MRRTALLFLFVFLGVSAPGCGTADDADTGTSGSSAAGSPATVSRTPEAADPSKPSLDGGAVPEDGGLRVVFLGTSLTAGLGLLRDSERYTDRLGAMADSAGIPARMVNAGVSGETSAGGLRRLDWVLDQPLDVLVVELGANDGLRGRDPGAMEANLLEIVRRTRQRHPGASVVIVGMEAPPNMGERYTRRFREAFARVADSTGAALVPFLLEGVAGVPRLNQEDGIHPTAEGHRIMARTVWPVLEPVLQGELADAAPRPAGRAP